MAVTVVSADSLRFARAAEVLGATARRLGLIAPAYRSPPRHPGLMRSVSRSGDGPVVAIRVRGRSLSAVLADMVDGVIAVNDLRPPREADVRAALWEALAASLADAA